jgi:hypothetical protein
MLAWLLALDHPPNVDAVILPALPSLCNVTVVHAALEQLGDTLHHLTITLTGFPGFLASFGLCQMRWTAEIRCALLSFDHSYMISVLKLNLASNSVLEPSRHKHEECLFRVDGPYPFS